MAPNPQLEPRPKHVSRNRDLAYRSSQDVSGPADCHPGLSLRSRSSFPSSSLWIGVRQRDFPT